MYREVSRLRRKYQVSLKQDELEAEFIASGNQTRKNSPQTFQFQYSLKMTKHGDGSNLSVLNRFPIPTRIIAYPRLGHLCGNVEKLREVPW